MSRGVYAFRDLDEEIFAPPECTHHAQLGSMGDHDARGGYYQSHSSPVPLAKAVGGLSESTILRRHLASRRARRTKTVLMGGIAVLLLSTVLLCVLSSLPATEKSALELTISAPYGALRRADAAKTSVSAPVSQEEAAAAVEMNDKLAVGVVGVGVGVGDEDPYDPLLERMDVDEADEQGEKEEDEEVEDDPYRPDDEEEGDGVDNEW